MPSWQLALIVAATVAAIYVVFVLGLMVAGRHSDARALAGFIPVAGQLDDAIIIALVKHDAGILVLMLREATYAQGT